MMHETLKIKSGKDDWRELPDNENTEKYAMKLSFAATVFVLFDSGEAWELDCGKIVRSGPFASNIIPKDLLIELRREQGEAICAKCGHALGTCPHCQRNETGERHCPMCDWCEACGRSGK